MCVFNSHIAKVGTGMMQTQPILSSAQPALLLMIKWLMLQVPPGAHSYNSTAGG